MPVTSVAVAGSTGSIGTQTLEVVASEPERFRVSALAATDRRLDQVVAQARGVAPDVVAIVSDDPAVEQRLRAELPGVEIRLGEGALASLAETADVVVNGVVGFAGLPVTIATLEAGKRLALANKESLIAAGPVVQVARATGGAELVPVDSEHCAVHQCLRANDAAHPERVARIVLTASGGPFRGRRRDDLAEVSIDDALAHPTWAMGPKITVDSSTLMNKGLEVIEAHELFGAPAGAAGVGIGYDDIDVVVHPQAIVHSMVDFFLLLLLPGAGDELQGIKRGIVEMADLIAVNKADGDRMEMAREARRAYRSAMHLFPPKESGWDPPVVLCSATLNQGMKEIWDQVRQYQSFAKEKGYFKLRRQEQANC